MLHAYLQENCERQSKDTIKLTRIELYTRIVEHKQDKVERVKLKLK